jgi:hypothetical protein
VAVRIEIYIWNNSAIGLMEVAQPSVCSKHASGVSSDELMPLSFMG